VRITPIASDSMGTRSMATFVETHDIRVLIDPSVALGPWRYGLPPHPVELEKMERDWEEIEGFSAKADVIAITHYHYDHHNPSEPAIFEGKVVLLKHPEERINRSQLDRAKRFLELIEGLPSSIEFADGREFSFGSTRLRFSDPVPHGPGTRLGYVTELSIDDGSACFVFTSDVEGPSREEQAEFVISQDPTAVYLDGPLSYMLGYRFSQKSLEASVQNMMRILTETRVESLIVDHHLLRDLRWRERVGRAAATAGREGVRFLTAAEFLGRENLLLEARRKELYASQ